MNSFLVFDIETDGFNSPWLPDEYANKIHCICAIDNESREYVFVDKADRSKARRALPLTGFILPFSEFVNVVGEYNAIVCHNQIQYDLPILSRLLDFDYDLAPSHISKHKLEIIDTLIDSRWLWPDRPLPPGCPTSIPNPVTGKSDKIGPHGLAAWAYRTGGTKPVVHDWRNQPIEVYLERCMEDARNNKLVFKALIEEMARWYRIPGTLNILKQVRDTARKPIYIEHVFAHIMQQQAMTGYPFNIQKAEALYDRIMADMAVLEAKIEPQLPEVTIPISRLKSEWKSPAKPFKGDGTPSANMQKWLIKHNARLFLNDVNNYQVEAYGNIYNLPLPEYLKTTEPLKLSNSTGIKEFLMRDLGWEPTLWNHKTGPDGRPERDPVTRQLITTTPKIKDGATGQICENLLALDSPLAKDIVLYNTMKHRRNMIKSISNDETGFLNHPRLVWDGRLPGEANTIGAGTCRVTHRVIANIPKADEKVAYGAEMRDLFYAPDGWYNVGWDAQAIEARLEGSEAFEFDHGEYAEELLTTDVHQTNADKFGVTRNKAKSVKYGLAYGAQKKKIANMLCLTEDQAEVLLQQWWEKHWATKMAIEKHKEVWEKRGKKCIVGVDGRPLWVRAEHSIFNMRLQNAGAMVMKLAACLLYKKTVNSRKTGMACKVVDYHDEAGWLVKKELVTWKKFDTMEEAKAHEADGINGKTGSKAIEKNGKFYVAFCDIGRLGIECIAEAGKMLGIKVALTGCYQVGTSWKSVH